MRTITFIIALGLSATGAFADNAPKSSDRQANPIEVEGHSRVEGYPMTSHNLKAKLIDTIGAPRNVINQMPTPDGSLLQDVAKGGNQ